MPEHPLHAGKKLRKSASEQEMEKDKRLMLEAEQYRFQTK